MSPFRSARRDTVVATGEPAKQPGSSRGPASVAARIAAPERREDAFTNVGGGDGIDAEGIRLPRLDGAVTARYYNRHPIH